MGNIARIYDSLENSSIMLDFRFNTMVFLVTVRAVKRVLEEVLCHCIPDMSPRMQISLTAKQVT